MPAPKGNQFALGNKGGRPTKYTEEMCNLVDKYLEENKDKKLDGDKIEVNLPTIGGFSLFLDIPERTLYDWKAKYKEFARSLEKIVKEQQKRLIDNGLSGDYNPTIAKLILSANHGMVERKEVENKGELNVSFYKDKLKKKSE